MGGRIYKFPKLASRRGDGKALNLCTAAAPKSNLALRLPLVTMKRLKLDPLMRHLNRSAPVPLYHYTSLDVLEKITNSGCIWATDVNFLNDKTEYKNAREFIEANLRERIGNKKETDGAVDLHIEALGIRIRSEDVFVTSFSTDGDSLSQWRGYGSNGQGVAIGVLPASLKSAELNIPDGPFVGDPGEAPTDLSLLSCLYEDNEKREVIADGIDSYFSVIDGTHPNIRSNMAPRLLSSLIDQCSPFFKHRSFREESEWRLVVSASCPDIPCRDFSVRRSMLVPHVSVDLKTNYPGNYITDVCIGPTSQPELVLKAVRKLLASRGLHSAIVRNSIVPYRTW
jgi:Protein of unknown function (DUF2971)